MSKLSQGAFASVEFTPALKGYRLDVMKKGVKKDIDRHYTYDIIPPEIDGGVLLQAPHRLVATSIEIQLHEPVLVYFIFHDICDGNYTNIFKDLEEWEKCTEAPQYDIDPSPHNHPDREHGKPQTMYKLRSTKPGIYRIPTSEKSKNNRDWYTCNLVFVDIKEGKKEE